LAFLVSLVAMLLIGLCMLRRRKGAHVRSSTSPMYDGQLGPGEVPWFQTHIYIEDGDLTCDFTMRVEYSEMNSRELLLECIARAAFEATEVSFDFESAVLARVDNQGRTAIVKTDVECQRIRERGAAALRICTRSSALGNAKMKAKRTAPSRLEGSLLLADEGESHEVLFKANRKSPSRLEGSLLLEDEEEPHEVL